MVSGSCGIRPIELGRNHRFECSEDPRRFVLGATYRAQEEQLVIGTGEDHPVALACSDQRADRVHRHVPVPNVEGCFSMISIHSSTSSTSKRRVVQPANISASSKRPSLSRRSGYR